MTSRSHISYFGQNKSQSKIVNLLVVKIFIGPTDFFLNTGL